MEDEDQYLVYSKKSNTWLGVGVGTSQWRDAKVFTLARALEFCKIRNVDEAMFFPVAVSNLRMVTHGTR